MIPTRLKRIFLPFVLAAFAGPALAATPPRPAPGHTQNWDKGRVDDVELLQDFHLKNYDVIEVLPPDVAAIRLPTDNTRDAVRRTLTDAARLIADELDSSFPDRLHVKAEPLLNGLTPPPRALLLRTKFLALDPGSRSKRGLSFGNNGKAHLTLSGELIDPATNQTVLRFTVHNDDGSHGDYEHVLQENLEHAVDRFARLMKSCYP